MSTFFVSLLLLIPVPSKAGTPLDYVCDVDAKAERTFAVKTIRSWVQPAPRVQRKAQIRDTDKGREVTAIYEGKKIFGTDSSCVSFFNTEKTLLPSAKEIHATLLKLDEKIYLDLCWVIGDGMKSGDGDINNGSFKFVLRKKLIGSNGEPELAWSNIGQQKVVTGDVDKNFKEEDYNVHVVCKNIENPAVFKTFSEQMDEVRKSLGQK